MSDDSNYDHEAKLVREAYYEVRALSSELRDPEFVRDFQESDWKAYVKRLDETFRELDALLVAGAPFPTEWVLGITTP